MQQPALLVACSTEANITAWDVATGSQLAQFKCNACGRGRLTRLGPDYLAAAQATKDVIHFWTWGKDQVHQRSFVQESLTALAASGCGRYLAGGGVSGSLFVWCAASGALLRAWPGHYKAVSCLAFADGGGLLVSGGEDGMAAAWLLAEVLDSGGASGGAGAAAAAAAAMGGGRVAPLHSWSEHTLPVTALCLGMGEGGALLVTASLDRSVKLWSVATGQLLRALTLPAGVTAVALDAGEHVLLAGCVDGCIYEASLTGQPAAAVAAGGGGGAAAAGAAAAAASGWVGGPGSCCYEGHTKAVSGLAFTPDGEQLVSGSEDGSARVWDVRSRQCLRTINAPNRAPVSGVLLLPSAGMLQGGGGGAGSGKAGSRRLQPLAPLAKFAGAGGSAKPWEGPVAILDGAACSGGSGEAAAGSKQPGLFLQPWSDALQSLPSHHSGAPVKQQQDAYAGAAAAGGGEGVAAGADTDAAGSGQDEVQRLQAQVTQLQAQLQDSRRVAQQWQDLHGQLHHYCTEQVLSAK